MNKEILQRAKEIESVIKECECAIMRMPNCSIRIEPCGDKVGGWTRIYDDILILKFKELAENRLKDLKAELENL